MYDSMEKRKQNERIIGGDMAFIMSCFFRSAEAVMQFE